jgi:exonuclease SbcD
MDKSGKTQVKEIHLIPKHDVRCVEGSIEDFLLGKVNIGNHEDYIQVKLLDTGAVFDAMNRLREIFPNLVTIDHPGLMPSGDNNGRVDYRKKELVGLFGDFYKFVTNEELTNEQTTAFTNIVNNLRERERQQ